MLKELAYMALCGAGLLLVVALLGRVFQLVLWKIRVKRFEHEALNAKSARLDEALKRADVLVRACEETIKENRGTLQ